MSDDDDWDSEPASSTPPAAAGAPDLWILVDASGSMTEGGKRYMVRNVARTVEQFVRLGHLDGSIRLAAFRNGEVWTVDWIVNDEFPLDLVFADAPSSPSELQRFLEGAAGRFLLVSDGFIDKKSALAITNWKAGLSGNELFFVPVGGDAVTGKHRDVAVKPEELWTVVDAWRTRP